MALHPTPEGYGPPYPRTHQGGTSVTTRTAQIPTAPAQYAPVTAIRHARQHDRDDFIVLTHGQGILYAGAFLTCFSAAITCGVACIAMWAAMR